MPNIYRGLKMSIKDLGFSFDKHKLMIISKHSDRVTQIMEDVVEYFVNKVESVWSTGREKKGAHIIFDILGLDWIICPD